MSKEEKRPEENRLTKITQKVESDRNRKGYITATTEK